MSAPVLTIVEQKASLSSKLKKKKTVKNILNVPNNLQVQYEVLEGDKAKTLCLLLERLLPPAKLPQNNPQNKETNPDETKSEALNKRKQLSLGVNDLSRCIKKEIIAAVLFASDIQPKFLINHLNLLCDHHKIPHLHIKNLRELTKSTLGFSCIAVGFKKDSGDFAEIVNEIKNLFVPKPKVLNDEVTSSESEDEEVVKKQSENVEPFEYLYRDSIDERKFIPEKYYNTEENNKESDHFIAVKDDDSGINITEKDAQKGISGIFMKNNHKNNNREEVNVPKKKFKKSSEGAIGAKRVNNYHPANVVKFQSNPNRKKKKNR